VEVRASPGTPRIPTLFCRLPPSPGCSEHPALASPHTMCVVRV
jgi:hypothetical protein